MMLRGCTPPVGKPMPGYSVKALTVASRAALSISGTSARLRGLICRLERRASSTPGKPFPTDIGKNPFCRGFCFLLKGPVMPILLWLLGVPLVVVIGLYLLHVI